MIFVQIMQNRKTKRFLLGNFSLMGLLYTRCSELPDKYIFSTDYQNSISVSKPCINVVK